ncbi:TorF family putative porin [Brevundimonas kwangchunensis]|uniref:TorF family putative porin n=1 Tax=Brevundimonas kwangchunensis TaxID=322163 RepID=A0ABP3S616_9CAUL
MTRKSRFRASGANDVWFAGACLVALVVWGVASHAEAQDAEGPQWSANVAVVSDYVFRGVSQTEEDAAISAGVDMTSGVFYAGAWASNVSFAGDDDTGIEADVYAGVRPESGGFNWDFGVVGYLYDEPEALDYDYVELKAAASRAVGPATVGAAVFWSPDFFGASEDEATYAEVNAAFAPADRWTVSGAVGRQWLSSDLDYTTWNIGAAWALTDTLAVDLRYHDTDEHDFGQIYESRAVASLKATF